VVIKALAKKGFRVAGQKGSHIFLTDGKHKLTVPAMTPSKRGRFYQSYNRQDYRGMSLLTLSRDK
jgi:hypothetical protein